MIFTWRAYAARIESYFNAGRDCLDKVRGLIVAGAVLKIAGVPTEYLIYGSVVAVPTLILIGWVWLRWGWYRQGQEFSYLANLNPVLQWQVWMLYRIARDRGLPINGYERGALPQEVLRVMESVR